MSKLLFPGLNLHSPAEAYFRHPPTLETERLTLRPMRMGDARSVYAWSRDPEVARYVLWDAHTSILDTREYLSYVRRLYRRGLPSSWGICPRGGDQVIGTIGIMGWSPENQSCEIGYSLGKAWWGQGYMTEAAGRLILSLFRDLDMNRIEAQHDIRNPASGRVLEKCGMQREGVLRSRVRNKGEYVDVVMWAVIRSDFHDLP